MFNNDKVFRNLRSWNIAMALLHFLQGLAVLLLSSSVSLPLTSSFLRFDIATQTLQPMYETIMHLRVGWLVAGFFFLSALAHLLVSLPGGFSWYKMHISKGINPARWIEYALSASLMMVVIAMLVGIYDIGAVLLVFFLSVMMNLCGWMMEVHNQSTKKTNWLSFVFGCIAGAIPWIVIAIYLIGSGSGEGQVPTFVYWIYVSLFLFFNTFAVNMVLQYKKVGPWKNYTYGEKVFLILSLVAKSLLAWQVFAGTLRPV